MRKPFSAGLLAALACLVGIERDAGATVTINLIWQSTSGSGTGIGTNQINADPGDTLTLDVVLITNQTLSSHTFSMAFDTDLVNELDLIGAGSWVGSAFGVGPNQSIYAPLYPVLSTVESTGAVAGRINAYDSFRLSGPLFLPTGTYAVGTARFVVTINRNVDGLDLFSGLFNPGDMIGDNTFSAIPSSALVFNGASVNFVPEPSTLSLVGLGLVGLVLAARRSRRG